MAESAIAERLRRFIDHSEMKVSDFANAIGISQGSLSTVLTRGQNISSSYLELIINTFPKLNIDWLITGNGSMIKESASSISINHKMKGSPYYNVDFIGGFDIMLNDQTVNPDYYIDFEPYNKPGVVWCNITGHSMEPSITHGDIIAMQEVKTWNEFILLDEVYGLVTDEFRTVKRISQSEKDGYYKLVPVNRNYNSQDIPVSIIRKVFKVLGSVKRF